MRRGIWVGVLVLGFAALYAYTGLSTPATAEASTTATMTSATFFQEHSYLGGRDGCRKCHLKQFRSWEGTPHATAIDKLEGDDASNPECLSCHTTGMGKPGGFVSMAETPGLANVQCEACHGAGSDYIDRDVMKNKDDAIAKGLQIPNEVTCKGCHNEKSPTFKGEFDFETMKAKGVHEIS